MNKKNEKKQVETKGTKNRPRLKNASAQLQKKIGQKVTETSLVSN